MPRTLPVAIAAAVLIMTAAACGGGSSSTPTSPTPPASTTPPATPPPATTPTDSATITIGADGRVTPSTVTITRGGRVTMINNDTRDHDMSSDPHPEHSQCPEINQIGFLTRGGQQRTSGNFNTSRTCGFHDHLRDNDANLRGTIIIQ